MSKPTFLGPLIGKGAGQCELVNAERGSVLATHVEPAFDSKTRKKGLLGRESVPDDYVLVIAPCSAVHTFFMRVPIDLVFVSRNGTITKTCRSVRPWRIAVSMRAFAVVEAAEGFIDRHEILPGETVELREIAYSRRATDTQPILAPAHAGASGAAPARHTTSHRRVSLADVIARKAPLAWFEATAIIQELCEAVLTRGPADDLRIPELKHIVLTGEGRVTLFAEGPAGHSPVQRAGLVLLALTPEAQLPMQLRLLILEEVSPRPKLSSLQDLHRELEFFERPDRQTVVREVYERFQRELSETTAAAIVPQPLLEPPPPKRHHLWWKRRSVWVGGWLVLMAMAAAAMMWVWPRPEGQWMRVNASQLSQASIAAGEKATQAVRREVDAAKWYLGFRPREPEPSVPVLAYAGPSNPPQPAPAVQMQGVVAPPEVPSFQLSKAQLSGTPEPIPAPAAVGPSGMVYSARDNQVVPPSLIKPQLSKSTPAGVRVEDGPELELVVSATGEVDSVKLVSASPGTQAGMKLSAVKAWRFEPATRNGQPVRYRLRVRLPAQ